jgi:hypothetical protein
MYPASLATAMIACCYIRHKLFLTSGTSMYHDSLATAMIAWQLSGMGFSSSVQAVCMLGVTCLAYFCRSSSPPGTWVLWCPWSFPAFISS